MNIGPVGLYYKTFATPADDADFNSVVGFTELIYFEPNSLSIKFGEEFQPLKVESLLAPIRHDLIGQSLVIKGNGMPATFIDEAILGGLLSTDITDKSGSTPKRYQKSFGGYRAANYFNVILRQKDAATPTLYRGLYVIKTEIHIVGDLPFSRLRSQILPVEITGLTLETGTHAGKLAVQFQEYSLTTPVLSTILPLTRKAGDCVVLSGTGFGANRGASTVTFYNAQVATTYLSWTDNSISVVIPATAATGNVKVTVGGVDSNNVSYTFGV